MEKKEMDRFHGLGNPDSISIRNERYFLVFLSDGHIIQLSGSFPNRKKIEVLIGRGSISIVNIMELNKEDWEEWGR